MQKILPITRVIIRMNHWIFKIRRGRMRRRRRKWLLRMVLKLTRKRATTTLKTTTIRKQKVVALKHPPPFTLKIPVNIVRILKCTEHWSWTVLTAFGTILLQDLSNIRSPDPRGERLHQRGLSSVSRLWSNYTQKSEDVGNQFLFPLYRGERRRRLIFHSCQIAVYLILFVTGFQ